MVNRRRLNSFIAPLVAAILATAIPIKPQTADKTNAMADLMTFAVTHNKQVGKQIKENRKLLQKLNGKASKDLSDRAKYAAYAPEVDAHRTIDHLLGREQEVLLNIINRADEKTDTDSSIARMLTADLAARLEESNIGVSRKEGEALVKLNAAQTSGADPKVIEQLRKGLLAYKNVYLVLDQLEDTLNRYFGACCNTSVAEIQKNRKARDQAEYAKYDRWMRNRERAAESAGRLIVAIGLVAALVAILKSPDSSPEQLDYAKQRMRELNDQARTSCLFRGGTFIGGGDYSIGTCTK